MAEETPAAESGGEAAAFGADPAAVALGLGSASRGEADTFLKKQSSLIDEQKHHLRAQFRQLSWSLWEVRLGVLLRAVTILVGTAFAAAIGGMVWDASQAQGLVIEAFSVPPSLATDGLTGEVAAARFLDKLQTMQTATESDRPANTFQNNWGDAIKLEIPETGLTFGEFRKLLRDELGHTNHITGEIYKTATGIALTARLGDAEPQTFQGPQADLDLLEQKAAEAVYRDNQPYRFGQYLEQHGRIDEAFKVISDLAINGPAAERSWAYGQWAEMDLNQHGDVAATGRHARQGLGFAMGADVLADIQLVNAAVWAGHDEMALNWSKDLMSKSATRQPGQSEDFFDQNRFVAAGWLASLYGDHATAAANYRLVTKTREYLGLTRLSYGLAATSYALDHDLRAARAVLGPLEPTDDISFLQADANNAFTALPTYWAAAEEGNWPQARADAREADIWLAANAAAHPVLGLARRVWIHPLEALALSRTGDAAGALALIQTTPLDCYLCLRVRGSIAARSQDWSAADRWFARAALAAPLMPFAYSEWGAALMQRRDFEGAIAKFKLANQKGPHFSDPLEGWGEALMAQNRSDLALVKFSEADKYAPNWGRLHLKWGEALVYAGRKDEAQKQFALAAGLALSAADKAELARVKS